MSNQEFKFYSATAVEGMQANFNLEEGSWTVNADMTEFLEEARFERELLEAQKAKGQMPHYRRFAVIPKHLSLIHI